MSIETDLAYLGEWLAGAVGKEVVSVRRLGDSVPESAVLLWPWWLGSTRSNLPPRQTPDARRAPAAHRRTVRVLLLAPARDDLDAILHAINERPIHQTGRATRMRVAQYDMTEAQCCDLFVAAQVPLQLAVSIEVVSETD